MQTLAIRILSAFTRNRHLLVLTVVLLLVAGLSALASLPRIEDPRIATRNAIIITPFPGASAARVEALVSKKIEDRLRELSEIKTIESTSRANVSLITLELQDWIDASSNEQTFARIRDRLEDAAADLPRGAGKPEFDDKRGAVAYSLILSLAWEQGGDRSLGMLRRIAEQLGDRMRNLPGTEQVVLFGAPVEEIHVDADAAELAALGLDVDDLAGRVAAADARRPAGILRDPQRDLAVELTGALDSTARVAAIPVAQESGGGIVALGDIATVSRAWQDPPDQVALHDGRRSILVAVRTEEAVRLDQWAERAREAVAGFAGTLEPGARLDTVFDQSRYTRDRLGSLATSLAAGAAIIVGVVWLMMGWRPALVVGAALPLSAGATLFGLNLFGEQIHQMSVFGMIIAAGLLIDNAIVITDRVVENRRSGQAAADAVAAAIRQLFTPLFASTFTTILGFLPIFLLPGNVGDFVGPIATAVVLALIASFALSMTVIPAMAGLLVPAGEGGPRRWWRQGLRSGSLGRAYRRLLQTAVRRPVVSVLLALVLPVSGFVLAGGLGMQFFPPAERDQLEVQLWLAEPAGISHTVSRLHAIDAAIRQQDGVEQTTWVAGASSPPVYYNQLRLQDDNPAYARAILRLRDPATARALEAILQDELTQLFRDAQIVVRAFGQGPPVAAPVAFRILGPELDTLRVLGEKLRAILHTQPEVTHTRASIAGGSPKLWLVADERQARLAGLTLGEIADQFQSALDGRIGGRVLEDIEDLPVRVRIEASRRTALDEVAGLRLNAGGDDWVPASAIGALQLKPEMGGITRRDGERVNEVQAFLRQGALPIEVTRAVQARLEQGGLVLPTGYRVELAGDSAEQARAINQLLAYVPVLATLMVATLVLAFRSFALAGLVGLVAVLSVGLGLLSLWAGGYPLGFNPIIGSAGLVGVAINGSIVVLAAIRTNPLARDGDSAAIVDATIASTRHILATTLTTVAGFMPLLWFTGGDFWPPLAMVIAGGVGLSGLLSLLLTPAAYRLLRGAGLPAASAAEPVAG